jgi:hypothetical protein
MYPDGKHSADDTWDGPGWCVCGRAWPCEAKRLGEVVAALATPAPPRIDVGRLARALVALARQQDPDALDADDDLVVAIALNPDDPADMAYAIAKAYEEDVT